MKFTWEANFSLDAEIQVGRHLMWSKIHPNKYDGRFRWWVHRIPSTSVEDKTGNSDTLMEAMLAAEAALREFATEPPGEQEVVE